MQPYGYGAPPPYWAPSSYGAPPAYGIPPPAYAAPYGAPPPYDAPPAPYGTAAQAPYAAPQPPNAYGYLQPAPYGAPAPSPYGAPAPSPYGAPPSAHVVPTPGASVPPAAPQPASGPAAAAVPASASTAPTQPYPGTAPGSTPSSAQPAQPPGPATSKPMQSAPPLPAAQSAAASYPSLTAPPPAQVVPADYSYADHGISQQRPMSAYPSVGGAGAAGPTPSYDTQARPATAAPGPAPAPYGAAPYNPQPPTAPFTYGQRGPSQAPAAPAPHCTAPPPAASQPYMPPTTYAPAPGHGGRRRRAVLVGCSYPGTSAALNGCLNDVQCIQFCLQKRFGFTEQQCLVLRDDPGRHPDFTSTKANIYRAIQWLMSDQQYGDSLFFHFSGHGSQQYDRNGDEEDGYDETICPSDFRHAGQIVDDELNRLMVRPLQPGVTLHAVIDACHSGTALDLPFRAKIDGGGRCYWKGRQRYDKMTAGGTAFQFGACKDSQVAQDTKRLSGTAYTGAATFCFIQAIEKYGVDQTYGQILSHMMTALRAGTGAPGPNLGTAGSLLAGLLLGPAAALLIGGGGQTPVLSCDKQVDLYSTKLYL